MKWTRELPTQGGWYWKANDDDERSNSEIVEVELCGGAPCVVLDVWDYGGTEREWRPVSEYADCVWSGPIPEPEP